MACFILVDRIYLTFGFLEVLVFFFFVGANPYHLNSLLMYWTRHLEFRLVRRHDFFQSSISHYLNSVSTFNFPQW